MVKVPQPHGGALNAGGTPGNKGGPGRPRSVIRDDVLLSFDGKGREFLDQVVSGEIVSKSRIPLVACAKHLKCANCGERGQLMTDDPMDMLTIEIEVETSATVAQRLKVAEMQMHYGLGALKEVSVDAVKERVSRTLDILQQLLSPEQFDRACKEIEPVWA